MSGVIRVIGEVFLQSGFFVSGLGIEKAGGGEGENEGGEALPSDGPCEGQEDDTGVERVADPCVDAAGDQLASGFWFGKDGSISPELPGARDTEGSSGDQEEDGGWSASCGRPVPGLKGARRQSAAHQEPLHGGPEATFFPKACFHQTTKRRRFPCLFESNVPARRPSAAGMSDGPFQDKAA